MFCRLKRTGQESGPTSGCQRSLKTRHRLVLGCNNRHHLLCEGRPFAFAQGAKPHKCHSDVARWVISEKADHVILNAAKNLDCYADLCNQALNCLAGLLYAQLYDVAVL